MLYNGSSRPLYEQLKDQIKNKIKTKELVPGDLLPGERKLAEIYNVSRVTVRQALNELINEGFLKSVHGKGTYVLKKKIQNRLGSLIGVAEELANENDKIRIEVISKDEGIKTPEIASLINADEDQGIFRVVRLISIDDQPIVINYTYLRTTFSNVYDLIDLNKDIIYYALEGFGYKIFDAEQTITASMPEAEEMKHLGIGQNDPVLVLERITHLEDGTPIIYEKSVYRADMYEYGISLRRNMRMNNNIGGKNNA